MTTFFFPDCFSRWRNNGALVINIIIYILANVGFCEQTSILSHFSCQIADNADKFVLLADKNADGVPAHRTESL